MSNAAAANPRPFLIRNHRHHETFKPPRGIVVRDDVVRFHPGGLTEIFGMGTQPISLHHSRMSKRVPNPQFRAAALGAENGSKEQRKSMRVTIGAPTQSPRLRLVRGGC